MCEQRCLEFPAGARACTAVEYWHLKKRLSMCKLFACEGDITRALKAPANNVECLVKTEIEYLNLAEANSNLKGFYDAHAYYVPDNNGLPHGYAARVSLSDFSSSGVEYLNLADTNSNLKGFQGGFATDAHAYYVPNYHGYVARVSLSDFSSSGVEYLNLAETNSNLKSFQGGFATDAHAYYVPDNNGSPHGTAAAEASAAVAAASKAKATAARMAADAAEQQRSWRESCSGGSQDSIPSITICPPRGETE